MTITIMYKYELDGIIYVAGELPDNATLLDTMNILVASEGYHLIRKADGENVGNSIWLRNGDVQENYEEEKDEDTPEEG